MKRMHVILFAHCVIFPAGMVTAEDKVVTPDSTEVRAAVDSGNAGFIEANRKQDGKLLASLFCEDGAFLLGKGTVLQGRANIEKEFG
jgi:hypothetical protein